MFEKIKKIFKRKPKEKPLVLKNEIRTYEKKIDHSTDISFENEIKKPKIKETKETKSSLTFGE